MIWIERVKQNVFPLSVEKHDIVKALGEWIYTDIVYDLEEMRANCQLCDQPNIRYQFEIRNIHNNSILLIGSECITHFGEEGGIKINDESGERLSTAEVKRKINRDLRKLKKVIRGKAVLNVLRDLYRQDVSFRDIIESAANRFKKKGNFTPKQLATIAWRLNHFKIVHEPAYFKMSFRNRDIDTLQGMKDWQ